MNDLTEIALNALERAESADNENDATDTTNDGADEKDTSNETDGGEQNENADNGETENTENDGADSGETENDGDDSEETDESETKTEKKSDEMTDEEFEEMAKKRGYSKKNDDDEERKKAEDDAKRRAEAINSMPKPKELDADTWAAMPPVNRVIYSRLPYITTYDKDGKAIQVKTPEQLPDDFEFMNEKTRAKFTNDIQAQETMAQKMANAIQGQARQQQESTQRQAQARQIISEVSALQKSGDLPTPKAEPNTPEFDTDPAVKTINKVLNYQISRARQGVNLSVHDALVLYRAEHPDEFKKPETKAKGDEERKTIAKKVAGNTKSTNQTAGENAGDSKRKYYRPGMSTQDVLDRALNDLD